MFANTFFAFNVDLFYFYCIIKEHNKLNITTRAIKGSIFLLSFIFVFFLSFGIDFIVFL